MAKPIEILVNYDPVKKTRSVCPDPVFVPKTSRETVIRWSAGTYVRGFTITGLDPAEFNPHRSGRGVRVFTTTDKNSDAEEYSYFIEVEHKDGTEPPFDPKIQNGAPPP